MRRSKISEYLALIPFPYVVIGFFGLAAVGALVLFIAALLTVVSLTVLAMHALEFLVRFL